MESLAKLLFTTDSHDPLPINVDTPYSPVITARDGKIQGRRMINEADFKADAYLGIPFASPPVGDLRFRKPVPPKDWSGIRQCFKHPTASVQISDKKWPSSEDCLYLNVFCPGDNIGKKFPVMVFIHGGAHAFSYIKKYGDQGLCDGLVRRGVIVVTVQYRLGILGFFSTGDEVCPGNFGLWDQIEALKWVQENIEHFGGDKDFGSLLWSCTTVSMCFFSSSGFSSDGSRLSAFEISNNVTLFGQCSGGVCADLISLSPYSRGLIHRLIPMSGNANATWAHQKSIADYCKKYAGTKLGIFAESNDELIEKLRCVPADQLRVRVYFRNIGWRETIRNFCPVIDGDLLPHAIEELRRTAPVLPLMAGVTTLEGGLSLRPKDVHEDSIRQAIDAMLPKGARRETRDSLVTLYKDVGVRRQPEHAVWRARVELSSDRMYNIPTVKLLTECSGKGAPTYLYVFSYYNPKCIGREAHFAPCSEASHSCDLAYVFNAGVDEHFEFSEDDKQMAETMTRAFINFTKRGNPNDVGSSTWLPCDAEHPGRHMVLDLNPRVEDDFNEGRCEKWLELFKQEHYLKSSL